MQKAVRLIDTFVLHSETTAKCVSIHSRYHTFHTVAILESVLCSVCLFVFDDHNRFVCITRNYLHFKIYFSITQVKTKTEWWIKIHNDINSQFMSVILSPIWKQPQRCKSINFHWNAHISVFYGFYMRRDRKIGLENENGQLTAARSEFKDACYK